MSAFVVGVAASASSFSDVRFEGMSRTRESTVRQVLSAKPGSACDSLCRQRDLEALDRLGVFAEVKADVRDDTLVYRVRELPWVLPVPNGRVSDEDGVSLGAGFKAPNLLGRAIAGEFLFLIGRSQEFQASITGDRVDELPLGFDLFAGRTDREDELRGYEEESHTVRLRLEAPTDRAIRVHGSVQALDLGIDRDASLSGDGRDLLLSGALGFAIDTRDRRSLVRRGVRYELAVERVGADADGWMVLNDARGWLPLGERWTLHGSYLAETQWGTLGPWRTFVIGGANTARGLSAGRLQGRSERLATGEIRWLAFPVRAFRILGQDLYWGSELVLGCDGAEIPDGESLVSPFVSFDQSVPFVERIRLSAGMDPDAGWKIGFDMGLFEKSTAQRFRVR